MAFLHPIYLVLLWTLATLFNCTLVAMQLGLLGAGIAETLSWPPSECIPLEQYGNSTLVATGSQNYTVAGNITEPFTCYTNGQDVRTMPYFGPWGGAAAFAGIFTGTLTTLVLVGMCSLTIGSSLYGRGRED